ncbi:unnamed protein product [Rotaria magnacalcarata]|uniref:Tetratricopeptide repeat protein n=1 Tax=Rotaria magnacalcarata TaxID=392030 RepID=A0A814GJ32_9BILA|nr:unnamed protein product [Rotaria magnacalcarata]
MISYKNSKTLHIELADEFPRNNYPEIALNHYKQLLVEEFTFARNDILFIIHLNNNLGTVYEDIDNNEQALQNYQQALELCITYFIINRELLVVTHHNIAIAYQNLNNMNESRSQLQCALTTVTSPNGQYYTTEIKVLRALALSYEKTTDEWASVAHFFQRMLDLYLRHAPNHPIVSKVRNAVSNAENKINRSLPTL